MAILHEHIKFYDDIFRTPHVLSDPVLIFGHQEVAVRESVLTFNSIGLRRRIISLWRYPQKLDLIRRRIHQEWAIRRLKILNVPKEFESDDFSTILRNFGANSIQTLDYLDARADIQHDMNLPISSEYEERFGTFIDIGCLEHVFDTVQCLENCMKMVRTSGHFVLHTPVNGYFNHGIHVFNPDVLENAFELNGFKVVYKRFSTEFGATIEAPENKGNVILWMVGRKERAMGDFRCPQQEKWKTEYVDAK